jgi:hypothetical protein
VAQLWIVRPIRAMKKIANIIQLVLTVIAPIAFIIAVLVTAHNHHPTTSDIMLRYTGVILFWLWVLYSAVHLFTRIILKMVAMDKTGSEKKL